MKEYFAMRPLPPISALVFAASCRVLTAADDSPLVSDDAWPVRVHVFEDYETEIEKRWWLRGTPETKELAPSLSQSSPNRRACRASATKDFDDKMGDASKSYKAVIFNPVPGPPMGGRTRLKFRYWLDGADAIRVQIYSLSNGYHRRIELTGLPKRRWQSATVDMTRLRRPDGSGGPLSADERIDDIQFYIDPAAELLIDDIVLYDAAPADETSAEPFPARVVFTGWFDTGKQGRGAEWPGTFDIVPHEKPRTWKMARSVVDTESKRAIVRVDLRGQRPIGEKIDLFFRYELRGGEAIDVRLFSSQSKIQWTAKPVAAQNKTWSEARVTLSRDEGKKVGGKKGDSTADQLEFVVPPGAELRVDDILLYEPGKK
jgi:hypothetical protein